MRQMPLSNCLEEKNTGTDFPRGGNTQPTVECLPIGQLLTEPWTKKKMITMSFNN